MPKIRGVKPETFTDDKVLRLTPLARWLFVGMWTHACDNGHVEDNAVQLKIRLLPMDSCDIETLIGELLATGQVERRDGYLKVVKLAEHQRIDVRYLTLCEWCAHDEHTTWDESHRPPRTKGARRAPAGDTSSAQSVHVVDGDGDGDGDGEGDKARKRAPAPRATRISLDFDVTDEMRTWAAEKGLSHLDLDGITENFVDHWRAESGQKARKLDWVATWRNWVKREASWGRGGTPRPTRDPRLGEAFR